MQDEIIFVLKSAFKKIEIKIDKETIKAIYAITCTELEEIARGKIRDLSILLFFLEYNHFIKLEKYKIKVNENTDFLDRDIVVLTYPFG